jgi:hypothetical protein
MASQPIVSDRRRTALVPSDCTRAIVYWIAQLKSYESVVGAEAATVLLGPRFGIRDALLQAEDKTMKVKTNAKAGVVISIIGILVG